MIIDMITSQIATPQSSLLSQRWGVTVQLLFTFCPSLTRIWHHYITVSTIVVLEL